MSPGAPRRGGGNPLGSHDKRQWDDDVVVPGTDRAISVGPVHELAERVRKATLDPIAHHHAGAQGHVGEEALRLGRR